VDSSNAGWNGSISFVRLAGTGGNFRRAQGGSADIRHVDLSFGYIAITVVGAIFAVVFARKLKMTSLSKLLKNDDDKNGGAKAEAYPEG